MNFTQILDEASTPTGHIFLKFGNKPTGKKDRNGDPVTYPVAWAGFGNNPSQVQWGNARLKFTKLHTPDDIVNIVKTVLGDNEFGKVFLSAKNLIIVPPKKSMDDAVSQFISWVDRNKPERMELYMDDDEPAPRIDDKVEIIRKRKTNPMKGKEIRKVDAADPNYTVHFIVSDRFYNAIRKNMPNLMQYKGAGQDFRMPQQLFNQFRDAAQQRFGDIGLKILKKAHTDEQINERSTSEKQARTMAAAAHDPKFAKKVGIKQSVAKEFNKADKGTKRLSNAMTKEDDDLDHVMGIRNRMNAATDPAEKSRLQTQYDMITSTFNRIPPTSFPATDQPQTNKPDEPTSEGLANTLGTLGGAGLGYYLGGGGLDNLTGILPIAGALGGGYLGHHTGKILGRTFDEATGISPMGHQNVVSMLQHVEQELGSMQMTLERDIEWHLSDFLGDREVKQLIAPINQSIENLKRYIEQAQAHNQSANVGEDNDPMVKNLPPINATGDGNQARTDKLASMAGGQSAQAAAPTTADKQMGANFEGQMSDSKVNKGSEITRLMQAYADTRDPTNYDDDAYDKGEQILNIIRAKYGDEMAAHAEDYGHTAHYGRHSIHSKLGSHVLKRDPLNDLFSKTQPMRINKSGIANRQDQKTNAGIIKKRLGKHVEPTLPEMMAAPSGPQYDQNGGKHAYESKIIDMDDDDFWLMEAGKASKAYCKANARKRENMGASQLSSCISQGYLPHKSGKSVRLADRRIKLNGIKLKGEKYGGPKSTKAGE
jgi:hypothetical protein